MVCRSDQIARREIFRGMSYETGGGGISRGYISETRGGGSPSRTLAHLMRELWKSSSSSSSGSFLPGNGSDRTRGRDMRYDKG